MNEYDEEKAEKIIAHCKKHGWLDAYGGPEKGGTYWRGVSPETGLVKEIPEKILNLFDLTPTQQKIYNYLVDFHEKEDRFPRSREIQKRFKWSSQTSAVHHLTAIEKKKVIEKRVTKGRDPWYRFTR